jgi:hypothetical protein
MITATGLRDSLLTDSLGRIALERFRAFVTTAQVQVAEYDDYSSLSGVYPTGGAIKGLVRPTTEGWHKTERINAFLMVQCEALRERLSTRTEGYLLPQGPDPLAPTDFLCLWAGSKGQEWIDVRPREVRVRLVGAVGKDSIHGAWIQVR